MVHWKQSRLLHDSWVDNRGYHDVLCSYGAGVVVEGSGTSR